MTTWTESWKRVTKGTFLPSYIGIGPVVSDKKIFKVFYIATEPYPLMAMFFDESWQLEQAWWRVTKGTFLPSYIEICSVVSDKKILKVFYFEIFRENKPHPLAATFFFFFFFKNYDCLKNLSRGSPKQHSSQAILKWVGGILQEEF